MFWHRTSRGEPGLTGASRLLATQGPVVLRDVIDRDATDSAEEERLQQDVLREAEELAERVRTQRISDPTTPEGLAFVEYADASVERITTLVDRWITIERDAMLEHTLAGRDTARRASIIIAVILALVTLIVVIGSLRLNRWRTRMIDALRTSAVRLADRAASDPLTGLMNHATFHEHLRAAVARSRRDGAPLGLTLIDLDHFKSINDTFGHQVGDQVLIDCAERLRRAAGPDDAVARVGGEEFAWLRPGADGDACFAAAERLREEIADSVVGPVRSLTISAGVCELAPGRTSRELYDLADGALYWAKAHGRNITFQYSPDVVEELNAEERAARLERLSAVNTVRALAKAVDAKDAFTQRHSERVGRLAQEIARELGWTESAAAELFEASLMHDVGKIGIPDAILSKRGRLTDDEMSQMRTHSALGAQIVTGVLTDSQVGWIRGHHEAMDGTGYPDGLAGDDIPEGARILALADAWDAMTGVRPYSSPSSSDEALEECRRCAGTQFWEPAVDALASVIAHRQAIGAGV